MAFPGSATLSGGFGAARRIARSLTTGKRSSSVRDMTVGQFGSGSTRASDPASMVPTMTPRVPGPADATPYDTSPASVAVKIAHAFTAGIKNRDIDAQNARVAAAAQAQKDAAAAQGTQLRDLQIGDLTRKAAPGYDRQHAYDVAAGANEAYQDTPRPVNPSAGDEMVPIPPTAVADLNKYLRAGLDPTTTQMKKSALDAYGKALSTNLDFLAERKQRAGGSSTNGVELTPEAIDFWARFAAVTGQIPSLGMGSSGAGARGKILNAAPVVAGGTDVATNRASYRADTASQQSLQRQSDAIRAFEGTAQANVGTLRQTMKTLQDTGSPLLNMPLREASKRFAGDPNVAAFNAALQVVNNEYARINTNPNLVGELSDAARREFRNSLDPGLTIAGLERVLEVLALDAHNRRAMTDATLQQIKDRIRTTLPGGEGAGVPAGDAPADVEYDPATGTVRPIGGR